MREEERQYYARKLEARKKFEALKKSEIKAALNAHDKSKGDAK